MNVGVVGLGLIGGSVAKAYKAAGHTLYGWDTDTVMLNYSMLDGVTDTILNQQTIRNCNLIFLCVYPQAAIDFLTKHAPYLHPDTVVIDCCGTKRIVCKAGFQLAQKFHFTFVGGHPMAGTQYSGFKYSRKDLFSGAQMVIVPPAFDDMDLLDRIKQLLAPLDLQSISVTTAEEHDQIISFTSQLAHLVSNAYIKNEKAKCHKGFSAGSYKDLTRVAWLNPAMWAQLFLENDDNLLTDLNTLIAHLTEYKEALENKDYSQLYALLEEGAQLKGAIDG